MRELPLHEGSAASRQCSHTPGDPGIRGFAGHLTARGKHIIPIQELTLEEIDSQVGFGGAFRESVTAAINHVSVFTGKCKKMRHHLLGAGVSTHHLREGLFRLTHFQREGPFLVRGPEKVPEGPVHFLEERLELLVDGQASIVGIIRHDDEGWIVDDDPLSPGPGCLHLLRLREPYIAHGALPRFKVLFRLLADISPLRIVKYAQLRFVSIEPGHPRPLELDMTEGLSCLLVVRIEEKKAFCDAPGGMTKALLPRLLPQD
jgi:hypothetical protein